MSTVSQRERTTQNSTIATIRAMKAELAVLEAKHTKPHHIEQVMMQALLTRWIWLVDSNGSRGSTPC